MDNTERSCRRRLAEETDDDCVKNAGTKVIIADNTERSCRRRLAEETDDDCVKHAGKTLEPR